MSDTPLPFDRLHRRGGGVSRLLLDRHQSGESLSLDERLAVTRALAQDDRAKRFVDELDVHVDEADVARLEQALARHTPLIRRRRWLAPVLGLAAAALVFVVVGVPTTDGVRAKGGDSFDIVVRSAQDGAVHTLLPGDVIAPGDALRFRVRPRRDAFVAIVGIDSARVAAIYAPAEGPMRAIAAGQEHVFEGSIVMDGTLGIERFAAVYCEDALSRAALAHALDLAARHGEDLAELRQTTGCDTRSIAVPKR